MLSLQSPLSLNRHASCFSNRATIPAVIPFSWQGDVYAVHGLSCVCFAWSEVTCDAGNSAGLALCQGFHIHLGQAHQLASKWHLAEGTAYSVIVCDAMAALQSTLGQAPQ